MDEDAISAAPRDRHTSTMAAARASGAAPRCNQPRSRGLIAWSTESATGSAVGALVTTPRLRALTSAAVRLRRSRTRGCSCRMGLSHVLYGAYERRLASSLPVGGIPRHVGVILDGNRRWAREAGKTTAGGHQAGADKIETFLGWCEEVGVE